MLYQVDKYCWSALREVVMIPMRMPPLPLERRPFSKQVIKASTSMQTLPSPKKLKTEKVATKAVTKKKSPTKNQAKQVTVDVPKATVEVTIPNNTAMEVTTSDASTTTTDEMREYYLNEERQLRQFINSQMKISNELRKMAETIERQTDLSRQRADFLRQTYG